MIITFCGHSRYSGDADDKSKLLALFDELSNGEDITFYLGGYGDFDVFCKNCVKKYKALYGIRCKTVWNQAAENAPSVMPCAYGDAIHADA